MNIKNNKGFSLIEVLVTVGLIGVLVSIAVPSYRNYKQGTVKMAMKVDLGNTQKVYGAKYAIDSSYCYNFSEVGLSTDKSESPIYKNKGFFGFGVQGYAAVAGPPSIPASACTVTGTLSDIQFISDGDGTCSIATLASKNACINAATPGTWTAKQDTSGVNANFCELGTNAFRVGAYSDVSNLDLLIQGDHNGVITEHVTKKDCQP